MADDGLAKMKKKIKLNRLVYSAANDSEPLDVLVNRGVNELAKSMEITDPESINRMCEIIMNLVAFPEYSDKDLGSATVDEWVEALGWQMIKYPRKYTAKWNHWFANIFDVIDEDHDGYINKHQFNIMYRPTTRRDDTKFLDHAFYSIDTPHTGSVSKDQFVDSYMKYMTDPDVSHDQYPLY